MNNYIVYIPRLSAEEEKRFVADLQGNFGANHVHRVGDNAYAVKTPAQDPREVATLAGVGEDSERLGFVVDAGIIGGKFYDRFWNFIMNNDQQARHHVAAA